MKSKGVPELYVARTLSSFEGPTTSQTQPEPWIASAVWKIRERKFWREPKSALILFRRASGITGSTTP